MKKYIQLLLKVSIIGIVSFGALYAQNIISDDFNEASSSTLNTVGWFFFQKNQAGAPWTATKVDDAAPLEGKVLRHPVGSSAYTVAIRQFAPTKLEKVGDSISLKLDFRTTSVESTGGVLIIKIINSEAVITSNIFGKSDPLSGANGYQYSQLIPANPIKTTPTVRKITSGSGDGKERLAEKQICISDSSIYSIKMKLSLAAEGTKIELFINGVPYNEFIDTAGGYSIFNTIILAGSTNVTEFDNVVLSFEKE